MVWDRDQGSLHTYIQLFQCHLLKRLSFLSWFVLVPWSKNQSSDICWPISGLPIHLYGFICLLIKWTIVLTPAALYYSLKYVNVSLPSLFFLRLSWLFWVLSISIYISKSASQLFTFCDVGWKVTEYIDHFGENLHLNKSKYFRTFIQYIIFKRSFLFLINLSNIL